MQEAGAKTVLGDFAGARFSSDGQSARFYRKDRGFFVRTQGPDGRLSDYQVGYAIGVSPLQQFVVAFPGGRFQVLDIAWDTRPKARRGQRWLRVPSDGRSASRWTRGPRSWNTLCAECHTTNLRKGYRWPDDRFSTSFSEVGVSCEACHGPAPFTWPGPRKLVRGGGSPKATRPRGPLRRAARACLGDGHRRGTAKASRPLETRREIEACGRCHAGRDPLIEDYQPGRLLSERTARTSSRRGSTTRTASFAAKATSGARTCRAGCTSQG